MKERLEKLLDRMIRVYGFENPYVIRFAKQCENCSSDEEVSALEFVVTLHERDPLIEE